MPALRRETDCTCRTTFHEAGKPLLLQKRKSLLLAVPLQRQSRGLTLRRGKRPNPVPIRTARPKEEEPGQGSGWEGLGPPHHSRPRPGTEPGGRQEAEGGGAKEQGQEQGEREVQPRAHAGRRQMTGGRGLPRG